MRIQKLSHEVVDQIAAGEVLERPANMIKEFIENSVDAGATEIEVDVEGGGRQVLIKDNGSGIHPDDLELALHRHATSKIKKSSDLWGLNTYGFRGEALASISAVSMLRMTSRHKDLDQAYELNCEFGKVSKVEKASHEQGTSIFVRELFSNVPARLKFLKSETAETTAIKKMIKAFALSFPHISVRLRSGGKLLAYYPQSENKTARVQQVLERKKMYRGEAEIGLMSAEVVYAAPNEVQRNGQNIWFFVQDRWIQDRSLQAAVMAGFENALMHGEYPICAVWITCDPQEVDVNVHPTKSQVKFRDPRTAFKVVREAVLKSVAKAPWLADLLPEEKMQQKDLVKVQQEVKPNLSFAEKDMDRTQYQVKLDTPSVAEPAAPQANSALEILKSYASPYKKEESSFQASSVNVDGIERPSRSFEPETSYSPVQETESAGEKESGNFENQYYWSKLQVLGQADSCYIVAQSRQSLILVDQHAAHERIAFERIVNAWSGGRIDQQSYLIPLTFKMEADEVEAIISVADDLKKLGIEVERSGPEELAVTSAPSFLKEKAIPATFEKLALEVIQHGSGTAVERKLKDIAATMACHSVVRAGQALSIAEMQALLEQMDEYPLSSFCPHGRPVFVEYPFTKIDKDFGRIV